MFHGNFGSVAPDSTPIMQLPVEQTWYLVTLIDDILSLILMDHIVSGRHKEMQIDSRMSIVLSRSIAPIRCCAARGRLRG
jgi:hypothetical protein